MKCKKISFIYFDLGGVVINNIDARKKLAVKHGKTYEEVEGFFEKYWQEACSGILKHAEYMRHLKNFGIQHPNDDLLDFFSEMQFVYPETVSFIHELKESYKLGILSNIEKGLVEYFMKKDKLPRDPWTVIIESAAHGTIKPEPKIYEIAEKHAGVPPEEIFFIDDRREMLQAGLDRGWQGMVFDSYDIPKSIAKIKKTLGIV